MSSGSEPLDHNKGDAPKTESSKKVTFPNGNTAHVIQAAVNAKGQEVFQQLSLDFPKALIVLSGGASGLNELDKTSQSRLLQLFSRSVARVAAESKIGFISGGTDSGVMAILGQAVAERGYKSPVIGIAPEALTTHPGKEASPAVENLTSLEPNHSHFVLVDTKEWGKEVDVMYALAAVFATQVPVFTLVVNGGKLCQAEVLRSVRLGFSIVVIEGSGRFADEIASLYRNPPAFIEDPVLAEIIADGKIHLFPLQGEVTDLGRLIYSLIRQLREDTILRVAWQQFGLYDLNANRQQQNFFRIQVSILVLGVVGTFLAALQATFEQQQIFALIGWSWLESLVRYTIIVVPISISALLAAANRFNPGNKWALLRNSAEKVKSEIFCYRAQAEPYSVIDAGQKTPEIKFAEKLQSIGHDLMQTEVNVSGLRPYSGVIPPPYSTAPGDNGLASLKPDRYVSGRLEDQLSYYMSKSNKLEKRLKSFQWFIYIIGGVGTLLAAVGWELWIALTTAVVSAAAAYLETQQIEKNLSKFNQAASDLFNIRTWWIALSDEEKTKQMNIDALVTRTERVLQGEFSGWLKKMQETIAELKEKQSKEEKKEATESSSTTTKEASGQN